MIEPFIKAEDAYLKAGIYFALAGVLFLGMLTFIFIGRYLSALIAIAAALFFERKAAIKLEVARREIEEATSDR